MRNIRPGALEQCTRGCLELYLDIGGFPRAVGEHVDTGGVSDGFLQGLWDVVLGDAIRVSAMSESEVTALLNRLVVHRGCRPRVSRVALSPHT
jgi:hypothetical protein